MTKQTTTQESVPMALDGMATPEELRALEVEQQKPLYQQTREGRPVPAIYQAMSNVMRDLGVLTPDAQGPTQHQSYPYVSLDKIVGHLRPRLVEHGVVVQSKVLRADEDVVFGQFEPLIVKDKANGTAEPLESSYWRGTVPSSRTRAHVIVEFTFTSVEDGSTMVSSSTASSADTGDKALRKAMSTCFKQMLLHTFAIASSEPEVDGSDVEEQQERQAVTAANRNHGQQKVDGARGKTAPRASRAKTPAPAPEEAAAATPEPTAAPQLTKAEPTDAEIAQAATARDDAADAAQEAAAPSVVAAPPATDNLAEAKAVFRKASTERNADPETKMSMVEVDQLAEKLTGKKREDWVKVPADLLKIAAAIAAGEVA